MGKVDDALNSLELVLKKDPKDPDALYFTGKTLMQMSRYQEALEYFQKAIAQDQYISSAYYGSIMTLRQLGKRS